MSETTIWLVLAAAVSHLAHSASVVQEVTLGDTIVLECPSNDENHRFQFWQLIRENKLIGPTNKFDHNKYKYEVLSGNLTIRGISSSEDGLYTCVSRHITDNSFYFENVELVVKRDWEEVYETDHMTNLFRITLVLAVLLVLIALGLVLYYMAIDQSTRFRALGDEETPDEPGPSHGRTNARLEAPLGPISELDSHGLDTELPRPSTHIFTDVRLSDNLI